jgi:hypothetical protein
LIDQKANALPLLLVGRIRSPIKLPHYETKHSKAQVFQPQKVATTLGKMTVFPDVPGRKFAHHIII